MGPRTAVVTRIRLPEKVGVLSYNLIEVLQKVGFWDQKVGVQNSKLGVTENSEIGSRLISGPDQ